MRLTYLNTKFENIFPCHLIQKINIYLRKNEFCQKLPKNNIYFCANKNFCKNPAVNMNIFFLIQAMAKERMTNLTRLWRCTCVGCVWKGGGGGEWMLRDNVKVNEEVKVADEDVNNPNFVAVVSFKSWRERSLDVSNIDWQSLSCELRRQNL